MKRNFTGVSKERLMVGDYLDLNGKMMITKIKTKLKDGLFHHKGKYEVKGECQDD